MKTIIKLNLFILASLLVLNTYGQEDDYWAYPCQYNPSLKDLFNGDVLKGLSMPNGCSSNFSSSMLLPSGTPPEIIEAPDGGPPDNSAYVKWSCTYSSYKYRDGDTTTAWAEGEDGPGIGVVLICGDYEPLKIWAGYGKSKALFLANNRPKKVRVVVISVEAVYPAQNDTWYKTLKVVKDSVVILKDLNGFQKLPIPKVKEETYFSQDRNEEVPYIYLIGLELLEVYPGAKYDDTCITEISYNKDI